MKRGFTLLEMVVVLTVLSIIFLLTVPNIQNILSLVETKGCDAQLKVIDTAVIQYKLQYDHYPNSMADLLNSGIISQSQTKCQNGSMIYLSNNQAYVQ